MISQFLPSPRSISVSIHTDEFRPHDHLMVIAAIWGEFIHHDVSHTPQGTLVTDERTLFLPDRIA